MVGRQVLVTGGLGFVGSALVAHLIDHEADVTVFDDFSRGSIGNIDAKRVDIVVGNLDDTDALKQCHPTRLRRSRSSGGDALHPDCNRDPLACLRVNVLGTENLLAVCSAAGIERIVAASSMAVYPISDTPSLETDPIGPYDVYGESKVANEMQLLRWSRQNTDRTAVAIRLANAYGPRETNPHVIPEILDKLVMGRRALQLGNTTPFRDYIHVDDIASGVRSLIEADLAPGYHVFNLGSGAERSVKLHPENLERASAIRSPRSLIPSECERWSGCICSPISRSSQK